MAQANALGRILKLQPGEGLKVLQFGALSALVHGGVAIGVTLTDALFLSQIGVEKLPLIYLLTPVVMLLYVPLFSRLVRRWGAERAFLTVLVLLVAGAGWLYLATTGTPGAVVYFAAKFFTIVAGIALYTVFWTFTDAFFDIQDGKRLFALFSAGGAAGAVVGGILASVLSGLEIVEPLFLVWAALGLVTLPLVVAIGRWHEPLDDDEEPAQSAASEVRRMGSYLPLFVASVVITLVLAAIAEYQYLDIFSQNASKADLSVLLGQLYAVAGAVNLVVNLFLFNRMVLTFGVPSVALVTPVAFLIGFTFLLVSPGTASAVIAFLVVQSVLESIDLNNQNFLYNAFPAEVKKLVRTAIEGLGEPVATAIGGAVLLLAAARWSPAQLSTVGVALGGVVVLVVLLLRGGYLRAMVRNLKESWLDLSQPSEALLTGLSGSEMQALRVRASEETDLTNIHEAIRILWLNDHQAAVDALLAFVARADAEQLVASRALLAMILGEQDSEVVRRILYWVTEHRYTLDPEFLEELGYHGLMQSREVSHLFRSEKPAELGAAVVTAWNSWRPEDRLQAMQTLDRLVQGEDDFVEVGVRATGHLGQESLAHFIVPYLRHEDPRIRTQAVQALQRTVSERSNRLVPDLLHFLEVGEEEDRLAALDALAKIADTTCIAPLLRASGDFTPYERREAERVLLHIGLKSVPAVVRVLRDPGMPYRGRALAARALGKLALPQLDAISEGLILTEIERAFRFQHFHRTLAAEGAATPGMAVLAYSFASRRSGIVDFILEILTIGGRLPDFELLSSSLRSRNAKERGNAIETIEQGVPRRIFRSLLPLIDGRSESDLALFSTANFDLADQSADEVVMEALNSPFAVESAAAAQAMWERGMPDAAETLRDRLTASAPEVLRETIISLFVRDADGEEMNPIERLHALSSSRFFGELPVSGLELLARGAETRRFGSGEPIVAAGAPAEAIHLVTRGEAEVSSPDRARLAGEGETVGEEAAFGAPVYAADAVSRGATTLVVSAELVLEAIRTYPSIGVELFRHRTAARNVTAIAV
ncbi:MAG TPA: cyclic nucleotide-binding domain-containing protein [Longimicrobiaceae bacterium]|nr:cyclic nucleotide-binding domain-containing protein [Longimicrobiaceae bacterium]